MFLVKKAIGLFPVSKSRSAFPFYENYVEYKKLIITGTATSMRQ